MSVRSGDARHSRPARPAENCRAGDPVPRQPDPALKPFEAHADGDWFIARTGYTGEDGLEIILPADQAPGFFNDLVGAGISPIGLGARDTLRVEAGMNLYGQDIDQDVSPLASNMAWSIAWEPAAAVHRSCGAGSGKRRRCSTNWSVWCWRSAVFYAPIRWFVSPMLAKGRSPVVVSLLR
jgi:hypothetical protein